MYRVRPGNSLILASASPRRRELLGRAGLEFTVEPAQVDESLLPGEQAGKAAQRLAERKARAVAARHPQSWVLAADTLVVCESDILGKPVDGKHALAMLETLNGREHLVLTGYCLLKQAELHGDLSCTRVRFRSLSRGELSAYLASGEPFGKAGAYAIQGLGASLVKEVVGSYTNVVGLPLAALMQLMLDLSIIEPRSGEVT